MLQDADAAPTTQAVAAVAARRQALPPLLARWKEINTRDIPALNQQLRSAGLPELKPE